jgi:hypothetical protein
MPFSKILLKRTVNDSHTHIEKRLNGIAVPSHLLFLHHPLRDDLIPLPIPLELSKSVDQRDTVSRSSAKSPNWRSNTE